MFPLSEPGRFGNTDSSGFKYDYDLGWYWYSADEPLVITEPRPLKQYKPTITMEALKDIESLHGVN